MTRLIDKLLLTKFHVSKFREVLEEIPSAEIIVADNVAKYYFDNAKKGWSPKDFPNIAPPFNNFLVEFKLSYGQTRPIDVGCLVISTGLDPKDDKNLITRVTGDRTVNGKDEAHWLLICIPLVQNRHGIVEPVYSVNMLLNPSGELLYGDDDWPVMNFDFDDAIINEMALKFGQDANEQKQRIAKTFFQIGYPALLTISFMHCKNVTLQRETPSAPLSKKYAKRHGRPLVSYHTLNIEPMKKVLRTEGNSEKTGLKQAIHICRGHFKDFSKGKGLFGKYKGLYFWESQVRGSVSEGIADKDYAVKAPTN